MIQQFKDIRDTRKIQALAKTVAELSVEGVCQRTVGHTSPMTTSESRGFIRARSARVIRRQTRLLLPHRKDAQTDWDQQIISRATNQVIPLVLRQLGKSSSPHFITRTAA